MPVRIVSDKLILGPYPGIERRVRYLACKHNDLVLGFLFEDVNDSLADAARASGDSNNGHFCSGYRT